MLDGGHGSRALLTLGTHISKLLIVIKTSRTHSVGWCGQTALPDKTDQYIAMLRAIYKDLISSYYWILPLDLKFSFKLAGCGKIYQISLKFIIDVL